MRKECGMRLRSVRRVCFATLLSRISIIRLLALLFAVSACNFAFAQNHVPTDPLALDLNGDGVKLTDWRSDPVLFDADHDGGSLEQTGWVDRTDGIAVYDLIGD